MNYIVKNEMQLPIRRADSHKGDYGKILLVGGSVGYSGSINFASRAAVRSGAGLVFMAVPQDIWQVCAIKNDEAMPHPFPCDGNGRLSLAALDGLRLLWKDKDVLAIGPGLGRSEDTRAIVLAVLREFPGIIILDADALWAVSEDVSVLKSAAGRVVLTPHSGEFHRLGGDKTGDRETDAAVFADAYDCIVILKGYETVIACPNEEPWTLDVGNAGMAKGGSGDVLTGCVAALCGQVPLLQACLAGAWIHSKAGDLCAAEKGEYGMIPGDIIEKLPDALKYITE